MSLEEFEQNVLEDHKKYFFLGSDYSLPENCAHLYNF